MAEEEESPNIFKQLMELKDSHNVPEVLAIDAIVARVYWDILEKLLTLLQHKGVLTVLEIEGIKSEAFDKMLLVSEEYGREQTERIRELEGQLRELRKKTP